MNFNFEAHNFFGEVENEEEFGKVFFSIVNILRIYNNDKKGNF